MPEISGLAIYADVALTVKLTTLSAVITAVSGSVDTQLWLGSIEASGTFKAASNPGTDAINVSIVGSSDLPSGAIKLATTQGGLASATAGAALSFGTSVTAGAHTFWVRLTDLAGVTARRYGAKLAITDWKYEG